MENSHNKVIENDDSYPSSSKHQPSNVVTPGDNLQLHWVNKYRTVLALKRHTQRPWATTWSVKTEGGTVWLKQLAPVLSDSIHTSPLLATRFPEHVPSVIAADFEQGLLLFADHGATELGRDPSEPHRTRLLSTYAEIQARSANDQELKQALPTLNLDSLFNDLLAFLNDDVEAMNLEGAKVSAQCFLSRERCLRYIRLLQECAPLLNDFLSLAIKLPTTINHCDLRPKNSAVKDSGDVQIFDWDEAVAGPAGLSLHAMFSGSINVIEVSQGTALFTDPEKLRQARRELSAYLRALTEGGYTDFETANEVIGASSLAGMLHYIISFSRFPLDNKNYQKTVGHNLKKRLSDLLDVCDWLCIQRNSDVVALASSHADTGSEWRAHRLLKLFLERQPLHAAAWAKQGMLFRRRGHLPKSIHALERSISIDPNHTAAQAELGIALARSGQYVPALLHIRKGLANTSNQSLDSYHNRVTELHQISKQADKPGTVPTMTFTAEEKRTGHFSPESLTLCEALFRKHGVLVLKDIFQPELLTRCHETFVDRYRSYLNDTKHEDALRIGDKRFQVTLDMEPPYNDPELYGNSFIVPLMKKLVGQECVLGCFVAVMSLPGSKDQRLHKDHKDLFHDDLEGKTVPSFAVTVMVPLVGLDEQVGTTRIVKGSHRLTTEESKRLPMQTPIVKLGDCYLMDYRLSHHGQANQSSKPRPIVSMLYQRPWFRDYMNFKKQSPMSLERDAYDSIPRALQPLFKWTTEPR